MSGVVVASQLPDAFTEALAMRAPEAHFIRVPPGPPQTLPDEARILLAAPFRRAGGELPLAPPGWPFGLEWVQLVSVGIDFYPRWLFDGPVVTSARGTSAVAVAEFALAAILAQAKRIPDIWIKDPGRWSPQPIALTSGAVLGIVGFGAIGRALAPRAQALGMEVIAVRRSAAPIEAPGVTRADSVADLFARSDHVVLAAPATPETVGVIHAGVLARAKPGLHLVNVARGALIEDAALLKALDDGRLSRATLDVTHPEPPPPGHPFYTHPKVFLSPHTAVHTPDTRANIAALFAENLARFRAGAPLRDVIDPARGY